MVYQCFLPDHIKLTFCRHLLHSLALRQPLSQPMKQQPSASHVALECFWISCSNDFQCSAEYPTSDVTIGSGKEWTQMVSTRLSRSYLQITTPSSTHPSSFQPAVTCVLAIILSVFAFSVRSWCWRSRGVTEVKIGEQVGDFNPHDHCSFFPNVLCNRHMDRGTKPVSHDLHYSVSIQRARTGRSSTNEKRSVPFTYLYRSSTQWSQVLCFCPFWIWTE